MPADVPFLGMRSTGDWVTNQRPESWREMILRLYPNGAATLTALTALMASETTTDPHYHWWTEALATQRGIITGVYTTTALNSLYSTGAALGTTLYLKMAAVDATKIRPGHSILLRCSIDPSLDVVAKVVASTLNGASSYLTVILYEADNNSMRGRTLADADVAWIIGNVNPEGGTIPTAVQYDPIEHFNYTQIFRTPLSITRTAKRTKLRTGDHVTQARKECLELHGIELEKSLIFGKRTIGTGANGKPERTTAGIREFILSNRFDFPSDGGNWLTDGWDWLLEKLEQCFRFVPGQEFIAYCGNGVLLALAQLAKEYGTFELTEQKTVFGLKILEFLTPFGTLMLKSHPLFTYEPTTRNCMLCVTPSNLRYRYIDDTMYKADRQANDLDGEMSEYLTECGLELHHEETFAWFDGVGINSYGTFTTTPPTTTAPTTLAPTTLAPTTL